MKLLHYPIFPVVAALPVAGTKGRFLILSTDNRVYYDNGASWIALAPVANPAFRGMVTIEGSESVIFPAIQVSRSANYRSATMRFATGDIDDWVIGTMFHDGVPESGFGIGRSMHLPDTKFYIDLNGKPGVRAGTSTQFAKIGGTLFDFFADATTTGTVEQDLYSAPIPAAVLATNGDKLFAGYAGVTEDGTNNKTIKIYFAGSLIAQLTTTLNGGNWAFQVRIIRTSATSVKTIVTGTYGTEGYVNNGEISAILANANILKITGLTATLAGDITAKMGSVEWKPAA